MKKWIVMVVILGGAIFVLQKWPSWTESTASGELEPRQKTASVETRNIEFAVSVAGEISPAEQVSVRPEINGRIDELPVDIGDTVKKGELLFTLDDSDVRIEAESRKTEIESARLQFDKAKRDYERDERLFEENLLSKEEYENSRTNFELAQNAVQRAERAMDLAKDRLSKTRIVAPFDCTVLTRPVSVGQAVSGSGGFNSGTEVLTIADLNEMIINAHVNQADVTRLKPAMKVGVQVEAVSGLQVLGVVERIAPQATVKNNIKGFAVRIRLKDIDPRIQPGMTAIISIPVESAENVTAVPLAAVFTELNPDSGTNERFAYVQNGTKWERRLLRIGVSDYFHAEVLEGLRPGEIVSLEQPPPELVIEPVREAPGIPGQHTQRTTAGSGT